MIAIAGNPIVLAAARALRRWRRGLARLGLAALMAVGPFYFPGGRPLFNGGKLVTNAEECCCGAGCESCPGETCENCPDGQPNCYTLSLNVTFCTGCVLTGTEYVRATTATLAVDIPLTQATSPCGWVYNAPLPTTDIVGWNGNATCDALAGDTPSGTPYWLTAILTRVSATQFNLLVYYISDGDNTSLLLFCATITMGCCESSGEVSTERAACGPLLDDPEHPDPCGYALIDSSIRAGMASAATVVLSPCC